MSCKSNLKNFGRLQMFCFHAENEKPSKNALKLDCSVYVVDKVLRHFRVYENRRNRKEHVSDERTTNITGRTTFARQLRFCAVRFSNYV